MTLRDTLLALFVVSMWGLGFTVMKPTMAQFPPILLMTISFGVTSLVLMLIERRNAETSHLHAALIALFAVSLQAALIFTGLNGLEASTGVLVAQLQVPISVLWAWTLRTEPFQPAKLIAFFIALAGVAIIAGLPSQAPSTIPLILMIAGGTAWGLGQVLIAKLGKDDGPLLLKRVALHGTMQLIVMTLLVERGQLQALTTASPAAWAGLVFIAFVAFALAYVIWFGLMRRNRVSSVTPFIMFMPAVSVLSAIVFLGEKPEWPVFVGGGLILLGLAVSADIISLRRREQA